MNLTRINPIRNVPRHRLLTAFMVISAAMVVFALALAPADTASTTTFLIWIAGALVMLGVWVAVAIELARRSRRYFDHTARRNRNDSRPSDGE
jgi:Sec-independent protein secretion pathway component TatC